MASRRRMALPFVLGRDAISPQCKTDHTRRAITGTRQVGGMLRSVTGGGTSTEYRIPSTEDADLYPVLSTQYSTLGTRYSVLSTRYSVRCAASPPSLFPHFPSSGRTAPPASHACRHRSAHGADRRVGRSATG